MSAVPASASSWSALIADLPLVAKTPPGWAAVALADFGAFLIDHASCERKAAASALALVSKHSAEPVIAEPMVAIAREELEHFLQVYRLITRRGLVIDKDEKDPYVNDLLKAQRVEPAAERLLDRLLISSLIEARSCERFSLVAEHLEDPELRDFYAALTRSEAGHYKVFVRIAERLHPEATVAARLAELAAHEAEVMLRTPWRPAVH